MTRFVYHLLTSDFWLCATGHSATEYFVLMFSYVPNEMNEAMQ